MRFLRPFRRRADDRRADNISIYEPVDIPGDETYDDYETAGAPAAYGADMPYAGDAYDDAGDGDAPESMPARRRLRIPRPRLPRPRLSFFPAFGIRFSVLLLALVLIAGGVFGTLLIQDRLRADVETWWPAALVGMGVVWMLIALARRQITAFLGGAALTGVGLSALMSTQNIATFRETVLGVVLVAIGLGIVVRGFLLRQRAPL